MKDLSFKKEKKENLENGTSTYKVFVYWKKEFQGSIQYFWDQNEYNQKGEQRTKYDYVVRNSKGFIVDQSQRFGRDDRMLSKILFAGCKVDV